jgi:hypothetical protein
VKKANNYLENGQIFIGFFLWNLVVLKVFEIPRFGGFDNFNFL